MKKILTLSLIAISVVTLPSCSKTNSTYKCGCSYTGESGTTAAGQTKSETTDIKAVTQIDALGQCSNLEQKYAAADFMGTCTLQ